MLAVEGNYGDIVHSLEAIQQCGGCSAPIALHPVPRSGRLYGQKTEIDVEPTSDEPSTGELDSQESISSDEADSENYGVENSVARESQGQEEDATIGAIKSYSTTKTPWYRRMPFTSTSD
jgi:hypothetical protein